MKDGGRVKCQLEIRASSIQCIVSRVLHLPPRQLEFACLVNFIDCLFDHSSNKNIKKKCLMRLREYHENLIVSWDHETRRQWEARVRKVNIKETKKISRESHCLMRQRNYHENLIVSWDHETMRQGEAGVRRVNIYKTKRISWESHCLMRPREYHENLIVSWDHETRRQREPSVRRINIYDTKRISWESHCLMR